MHQGKKAAGIIDVSWVAPPSAACLVLPFSLPVRTCFKRWRKPKLILRIRIPSLMELCFVFLHACMHTFLSVSTMSCKQWCDCCVLLLCIEACIIPLLSYTKTENRHKERKYSQLWCMMMPAAAESPLMSCAQKDTLKDIRCLLWLFKEGHRWHF